MTRTTGIIVAVIAVAVVAGAMLIEGKPASPAPAAVAVSVAPALPSPAATSSLPVLTTMPALAVGTTTAILEGKIRPNGSPTTYWFEYSADPNMGAILLRSTPRIALSTTTGSVAVEVSVMNLVPSTTYYFRLAAANGGPVVHGDPASFLTK